MCDPILVTLLKMRPHYGQSSHENATPSSGTSALAFKKIPPRVSHTGMCHPKNYGKLPGYPKRKDDKPILCSRGVRVWGGGWGGGEGLKALKGRLVRGVPPMPAIPDPV